MTRVELSMANVESFYAKFPFGLHMWVFPSNEEPLALLCPENQRMLYLEASGGPHHDCCARAISSVSTLRATWGTYENTLYEWCCLFLPSFEAALEANSIARWLEHMAVERKLHAAGRAPELAAAASPTQAWIARYHGTDLPA